MFLLFSFISVLMVLSTWQKRKPDLLLFNNTSLPNSQLPQSSWIQDSYHILPNWWRWRKHLGKRKWILNQILTSIQKPLFYPPIRKYTQKIVPVSEKGGVNTNARAAALVDLRKVSSLQLQSLERPSQAYTLSCSSILTLSSCISMTTSPSCADYWGRLSLAQGSKHAGQDSRQAGSTTCCWSERHFISGWIKFALC